MPVVYIAPFVALGVIAFLTCLVLPSLQRYALYVLVAPIGFGLGVLGGFIVCVTLFVLTGYRQSAVSELFVGVGSVASGAIWAWVAVIIVKSFLGAKKALSVPFWNKPRRG